MVETNLRSLEDICNAISRLHTQFLLLLYCPLLVCRSHLLRHRIGRHNLLSSITALRVPLAPPPPASLNDDRSLAITMTPGSIFATSVANSKFFSLMLAPVYLYLTSMALQLLHRQSLSSLSDWPISSLRAIYPLQHRPPLVIHSLLHQARLWRLLLQVSPPPSYWTPVHPFI